MPYYITLHVYGVSSDMTRTSALHARLVKNDIQEVAVAALVILFGKNEGRDLHQEAAQLLLHSPAPTV